MQGVADYFHIFAEGEECAGLFAYAMGRGSHEELRAWHPDGEEDWAFVSVDSWSYQGAAIAMLQVGLRSGKIAQDVGEWRSLFRRVMNPVLQLGAEVAWLGAEDSSWNPEVLRPGNSFGNVAAALDRDVGLLCEIEDTRAVAFLSDATLSVVWSAVASFLDGADDEPEAEGPSDD